MSNYLVTDTDLTAVADAIRTKGGTSAQLEFPTEFVSAIGAISGGNPTAEYNDVVFWDYDGSMLYSYSATEFATLAELPANPTHDGLTAQGWNWTLADAKAKVAEIGFLDIGQLYVTSDGATHFHIVLTDLLTVSIQLSCSVANDLVLDWGDNSATETNSSTGNTLYQHTYATSGTYVIKVSSSSGTIMIANNTSYGEVFSPNSSGWSNDWDKTMLREVNMGYRAKVGMRAFRRCTWLSCMSVASDTDLSMAGLQYTNLKVLISSSTFGAGDYYSYQHLPVEAICFSNQSAPLWGLQMQFANCVKLRRLSVSMGRVNKNAASQLFSNSFALEEVLLTEGTLTIGTQVFNGTYALKRITIPSSITSISNNCFLSVASLREVHLEATTPPTLGGTTNFTEHPSDMVIYVPYSDDHSVLEAYQTATNWSSFASYMQEEPQ